MPAPTMSSLLRELNLDDPSSPPDEEGWRKLLARAGAADRRIAAELDRVVSESEERYESLLRSAPFAILILAVEDGSITSLNPAFEELTGWSAARLIGKDMTALSHPDDIPTLIAWLHQATLGETSPLFELRLQTSAGGTLGAELLLAPQLTGGRVRRIYGFARDVTERRAAIRDLRAAKEAAEAASGSKSEFLANVSHEIRTPLNATIGMTSLLLDTPLTSQQAAFAEGIRASSHALLTLIDNVLDFSKIESGRLELERQPFNLLECLQEAVSLVAPRAAEKGLELSFTISEDCPMAIEGDVVRVRQVLVNLLSNAIKFTDQGSVEVGVEARPKRAGEHEVRFAVRDTGIGIAPEKTEQIFDAFSQADASTTRGYGGTGLGLSISKRLAELMGGRIEVDSLPGRGSTFRFSIRARPTDEATLSGRREIVRKKIDRELAKRLPLVILVADDNPTNREVAWLLLQRMGYEADLASNGKEVLEAMSWRRYDLVLLDVHMPVLDGLETVRCIRDRWDAAERPQIVAMTASTMQGDREKCIAAGMDDFLAKPILDENLQSILERSAERVGRDGDDAVNGGADRETATASEPALPVLDPEAVRRLSGLPFDRIAAAIRVFLELAQEKIREIRSAIEEDDGEKLSEAAHSLKGSSLTLGVARVGELSGQLERRGLEGSAETAKELLEELVSEEEAAHAALEDWLASGP